MINAMFNVMLLLVVKRVKEARRGDVDLSQSEAVNGKTRDATSEIGIPPRAVETLLSFSQQHLLWTGSTSTAYSYPFDTTHALGYARASTPSGSQVDNGGQHGR